MVITIITMCVQLVTAIDKCNTIPISFRLNIITKQGVQP